MSRIPLAGVGGRWRRNPGEPEASEEPTNRGLADRAERARGSKETGSP